MKIDIGKLQTFYKGFYIRRAAGNNAFSYAQRKQRQIYVPPIIEGTPDDMKVGGEIAFSEVVEGEEINRAGLKNFVYLSRGEKDIFVFDNHNHAFFFWIAALQAGKMKKETVLVHVDQHHDTRDPQGYLDAGDPARIDLRRVFRYTNFVLNVGNFIKPALQSNLFSRVIMIDSSAAFEKPLPPAYVLDIDADIFSEEMGYIDHDYKIAKIRRYLRKANLITIASSPFFMDQQMAIKVIRELLREK